MKYTVYNWNDIQVFYDSGKTYNDVIDKYGCGKQNILSAVKNGLFKPRTISESRRLYYKNNIVSLSDDVKVKISHKLRLAHKEGRHPGWTINGRSKRSYPEKRLYSELVKSGLFDYYTIIEKFPLGRYWFDFALIDHKIDIEIDGQQHYRTNGAIEHDVIRDEFSKSMGWRVFRISWEEFKNNSEKVMTELLNFINDNKSERIYSINDIILSNGTRKITKEEYYNKRRIEKSRNSKVLVDLVRSSNIKFGERGWVNQVSRIIGKSHQKVKKWLQDNMPELYSEYY